MLWAAIVVFAIAAVGGLTLAAMRLAKKPLPLYLAAAHGIFAALGLILLAIALAGSGGPDLLVISLIIFVLAALGGAAMFFGFYLRSRPLPIPLVLGHGALAVTALVLALIVAV